MSFESLSLMVLYSKRGSLVSVVGIVVTALLLIAVTFISLYEPEGEDLDFVEPGEEESEPVVLSRHVDSLSNGFFENNKAVVRPYSHLRLTIPEGYNLDLDVQPCPFGSVEVNRSRTINGVEYTYNSLEEKISFTGSGAEIVGLSSEERVEASKSERVYRYRVSYGDESMTGVLPLEESLDLNNNESVYVSFISKCDGSVMIASLEEEDE